MAIDGFSFTTIADGRVDPDSPLDTTLATDWRDNIEFLQRWLGKSFLGAAVADHNHDAVNSKAVDFGDITGSVPGLLIWIDDGTIVYSDGSNADGLVSISSQVPVNTQTVQIVFTLDGTGGATTVEAQARDFSGTYRRIARLDGGGAVEAGFAGIIPVNGSRQIDRKTILGAGGSVDAEVRSYSL